MAPPPRNYAVVVLKGHAATEKAKAFVTSFLTEKGITIEKEHALRAVDVLDKHLQITRIHRMAFSFLDEVFVFEVSWEGGGALSWTEFRQNIIGDMDEDILDEPTSPSATRNKKSIRSIISENYKTYGLEDEPSADNNIIYCSPSAIAAVADRLEWCGYELEHDPLVQLVARSTENGYELIRRLARNVYFDALRNPSTAATITAEGLAKGNAFDLLHEKDAAQVVAFIQKEEPYYTDCLDSGKRMGARRSTVRVSGEAPVAATAYVDEAFRAAQTNVQEWVRIGDLYPALEDGALVPNEASTKQFCQGLSPDCTLLSALALLCERHPAIIDNLFVSKEVRKDGRYTFQFYRWDKWERVEIDDAIPCAEGREVINCRSPTGHWWPLLLEKAYAKFYGSYGAIQGGVLSETLHDLTAKPVESLVLTEQFVQQGAIGDYNEPSFWTDLFKEVESGKIVMAFPASRGDGSDDGPTQEDSEELGFEPGHGYAVLDVKMAKGAEAKGQGIENIFVKLHNPFSELGFKEVPISDNLPASYRSNEERDDFWVSVDTLLEVTQTVFVCRINGIEDHPFINENRWERGTTAAGPPSSVAWRQNPIYTLRNKSGADIKAMVVLKQRDQRRDNPESSQRDLRYIQGGVVCVRYEGGKKDSNASTSGAAAADPIALITTPYIANNLYKPFHRGVYLNQREVCDNITFAANSLSYIVPSTVAPGEVGDFILAVYLPLGTPVKAVEVEKLHCGVDHAYPLHREMVVGQKEKVFTDLVLRADSEVHCLLRQVKDKSGNGSGGSDVNTDIHVALTIYNENNERVGGMTTGLNYKENAVIAALERGRYSLAVVHAKGNEQLEADLFVSVHPDSDGVLAPHRDLIAEAEERAEVEAEIEAEEEARKQKLAEADSAAKKAKEEAKKKKEAEDAAAKEAEEAEKKKRDLDAADAVAKAEKRAAEAEKKKAEEAAAAAKKKKEEEEQKAQKKKEEEEQKVQKKKEEEEKARKKKEEEERENESKRQKEEQEEAERQQKAAEEEEHKRRKSEEKKRKSEEKKAAELAAAAAAAATTTDSAANSTRSKPSAADDEATDAPAAEEQHGASKRSHSKDDGHDNKSDKKAKKSAREEDAELKAKRRQDEATLKKKQEEARKQFPGPPAPPPVKPVSPRNEVASRYMQVTKASQGKASVASPMSAPSNGQKGGGHTPRGGGGGGGSSASPTYSDKAPKLPPLPTKVGFGTSSPRMCGYTILPFIQKYEEVPPNYNGEATSPSLRATAFYDGGAKPAKKK